VARREIASNTIQAAFAAMGGTPKSGITVLPAAERHAASRLLSELHRYGIFAVAVGEVEHWLVALGATGHGGRWLVSVFERMGSDPTNAGYVTPGDDNVWQFIEAMRTWIGDAARLDMS
jgi:hypothetical protein